MSNSRVDIKLDNLGLYKRDGDYFLRATYLHTDKVTGAVDQIIYPKILLPLSLFNRPDVDTTYTDMYPSAMVTVNLGFGRLPLEKDDEGGFVHVKQIVKPIKKMTVEEIEKALGHRVEIISK